MTDSVMSETAKALLNEFWFATKKHPSVLLVSKDAASEMLELCDKTKDGHVVCYYRGLPVIVDDYLESRHLAVVGGQTMIAMEVVAR